jgi:hypothetical protein
MGWLDRSYLFFFTVVQGGGALWHLQINYMVVEFTPSTASLYPPTPTVWVLVTDTCSVGENSLIMIYALCF